MIGKINLAIEVEELTGSFVLNDCTGNYSSDNKGGYGIPNYDLKNLKEAFLEVWSPSDQGYIRKVTTTPEFPAKDGFGIEIFPSMIDLKSIESGLWKFKFTVIFNAPNNQTESFTAYDSKVFIKDVECCVDKATSGRLKQDTFKDEKQKLILELSNLLEDVKYQIDCGNYDNANKTIDYLKSHCKCCGCNS